MHEAGKYPDVCEAMKKPFMEVGVRIVKRYWIPFSLLYSA
ncbi:hypothetical protein XYCOK13_25160 [Xylanibacillus composti]|uniref:Uncharacterized protein n=1 Tax=Xylanibacillus composti TaxID=1572762 RepID=A0A8J4H2D4_9BACL|nr:hypothetical protein XYCOK13_25160 [Xylanibacillus composti]